MTKITTLNSPAKINLFLKVLNKRHDGYHNIETLFERVDLFDIITFKTNKTGKINLTCSNPSLPTGPKNLIYKAAKLLQEEYHVKIGVDIELKKRIPVAAGLGGGSSNAATTLLGLNSLWCLNLNKKELIKYADKLGSDITFFLHDTTWALGTERGNKIKEFKIKAKLWHVLVVPHIKLYSGEVYGALNLQLTNRKADVNILIHNLNSNSPFNIGYLLNNDLEKPILKLCPDLEKIKQRLKLLDTKGVMISGSGPAVFALTDSKKKAQEIKEAFKKRYKQVFIIRTY